MFFNIPFATLSVLSLTASALGREVILERDGKAVFLAKRRFGQENPAVIQQVSQACGGGACATIAGSAISTLLAASPECAQQDKADAMIDLANTLTSATEKAALIAAAIKFRQAEKNTPPDFTTNPPTPRNSVFCQKPPRNSQLSGLVQAQDPANDPNLFFDPATKSTVTKGSQLNTFPFGSGNATITTGAGDSVRTSVPATSTTLLATACPAPEVVTVTVTGAATAAEPSATDAHTKQTFPGSLDLGSCTDPTVEFGPAFEGRKLRENSFEPVNKAEFPHGSALNAQIVFNAICDILANKCKAPSATVDACKSGATAAQKQQGGAQADTFNAALGFKTDFANVPAAPGGGPGNATLANTANFHKCTNPTIVFGPGFDGRKEDSFQPANKTDFNHGSALDPNIITQFICDTLVNTCDANEKAIDSCKAARTAANGLSGQAFADAFNKAIAA